jgi:hypothetical protein
MELWGTINLGVHGLINRAIQTFLRDTYGAAIWQRIVQDANLGFDSFEPMLIYRRSQTVAVIKAAARILDRSPDSLLEDLGTALVSRSTTDPVRRLMRFGGVTFVDFLHSLEELRGRGRMAVPDLDLPDLELDEAGPQIYRLTCTTPMPGAAYVLMGLLRAMADDYGALVVLDYEGSSDRGEVILVHLLDQNHATARRFDLAAPGL